MSDQETMRHCAECGRQLPLSDLMAFGDKSRARGWQTLAYSRALVSGRWWKLFGCALLLVLINLIPSAVITPVTLALQRVNPAAAQAASQLLALIGLPFQLFGTTFAAIYFLNLHLSGVAAQKYPHLSPRQNR